MVAMGVGWLSRGSKIPDGTRARWWVGEVFCLATVIEGVIHTERTLVLLVSYGEMANNYVYRITTGRACRYEGHIQNLR